MPEEKSVIEICDVTKMFGAFKALGGVSVSIRENEFFTLLGPSGCGKTTLLRLIAGFEYPTDGAIRLHGKDIAALPPYQRPINTVFQNYALFPHMTVGENIGFGLEMLGRSAAAIAARVEEMLRLVRMEDLKHRKTTELSGGQQQRVALARALAPAPKVLLLDEPLSALDYKLRKEMQIELKNLQLETGITFIFVTHDQEEALTMSDRIAVMSGGSILQVGNPREIYDSPRERFVAEFIGEANFLNGEIVEAQADRAQIRLAAGAEIAARLPAGAPQEGEVTVFVRPEHAKIHVNGHPSSLSGTLESIVYLGTDTHLHVLLDDGNRFVVRRQNSPLHDAAFVTGAKIGVAFDLAAAQVLRG